MASVTTSDVPDNQNKKEKKIRFVLPAMNNTNRPNKTVPMHLNKHTYVPSVDNLAPDVEYEREVRMIVLGNSYVGKSAFIFKYTTGQFCHPYLPTVGYDYITKYLTMKTSKEKVKIELWDTSGDAAIRDEMSKILFAMMSCFIVMYDVTDIDSYNDVYEWMKLVEKYGIDNRQIVIIGNKTDLQDDRQITRDEGIKLAETYNAKFMEISVRRNHNIHKTMSRIVENLCENSKQNKY